MKILIFLLFFPIIVFSQNTHDTHTVLELEQIKEINLLRSDPSNYINIVKEWIKNPILDPEFKIIAEKELIPLLASLKPLPQLIPNDSLRKMLDLHKGVDSVINTIYIDSNEIRRSNPANVKNFKHGNITSPNWKNYGENIVDGENIRAAIIKLLIDPGIPDRGHRMLLLNSEPNQIAIRLHSVPTLYIIIENGKETHKNKSYTFYWIQKFIKI